MTKSIYLIAGEPSGDDIGHGIIDAILAIDPSTTINGLGGPKMTASGLKSLFPYEELNIMGLVEILPHIFKIKKRIQQTVNDILEKSPDVVVTIDAPGFTKRVIKGLREHHFKGKVIHCVAPTVWAWRPKRAESLAKLVDELLCLFPFEPPYFEKHGLKTHFIGHPLADQGYVFKAESLESPPQIALLPGSRKGEITKLLPIFIDTLNAIDVDLNVNIITLPHLVPLIEHFTKTSKHMISIITNAEDRNNSLLKTDLAIASSGTVTLETGLRGIPTLVTYRVSTLTYWILKCLVKTKYASLVNILAQAPIFPERLQNACKSDILKGDVLEILSSKTKRASTKKMLLSIQKMTRCPNKNQTSAQCAAQIIMEKLT